MPTITICTEGPLPTFASLHAAIKEALNLPNFSLTMPEMPTFPAMPNPGLGNFSLEGAMAMAELQANAMLGTLAGLIEPLIKFIKDTLKLGVPPIPLMPVLEIDIFDLLAGQIEALVDSLKQMLIDNYEATIALVKSMIPVPLYPNLKATMKDALQMIQAIVREYQTMLIDYVASLIKIVTDKLKLAALPTLPKMPTSEELLEIFLALLPTLIPGLGDIMAQKEYIEKVAKKSIADARAAMGAIPNLLSEFGYLVTHPKELLKRLGIDLDADTSIIDAAIEQAEAMWEILKAIEIPSMEELMNAIIPAPFPEFVLPDLSDIIGMIESEFQEAWKNLKADLQRFPLQMILDFIDTVLTMVPFPFPLPPICIPIEIADLNIPKLPDIPDIPEFPEPPELPELPDPDAKLPDIPFPPDIEVPDIEVPDIEVPDTPSLPF